MSDQKKSRSKSLTDETKVKYAIDFIEELAWLLDSKKKLKLSEVPEILRSKLLAPEKIIEGSARYVSPNPNIHYLIGVLPRLFQDLKLFSRNEDIAEFANDVLGIEISRVEKRSRYELIGLIVCSCNDLVDEKLDSLVDALSAISDSTEKINMMVKEKSQTGFSWNETIRNLANLYDT